MSTEQNPHEHTEAPEIAAAGKQPYGDHADATPAPEEDTGPVELTFPLPRPMAERLMMFAQGSGVPWPMIVTFALHNLLLFQEQFAELLVQYETGQERLDGIVTADQAEQAAAQAAHDLAKAGF